MEANRGNAITVRQLYEALGQLLKDLPQVADWPMYADGCDCIEPAGGIEVAADAHVGPFVGLVREKADVDVSHPKGV